MRVLLFTGKGGVGKTTIAASTAVHAARHGVKTLVLSTDAAHSLGDALGTDLTPGAVDEIEPGLFAQQLDPQVRLTSGWDTVRSYLLDVLTAVDVEPMDAAELTTMPGADDVLTLFAVRDQVSTGPWDLVIVDCAPTAETLRLLTLPEALTRLVDRLLPAQRVLARSLAPAFGRMTGLPAPAREVGPALVRLRSELSQALEVMRAPTTSIRLVLTPEQVVLAEARRTLTALSLQGFVVDGVIANRVIPAAGGGAWQDGWARAQAVVLDEARASFAPLSLTLAAYLPAEPVGPQALAELADALVGAEPLERLLASPGRPGPLRVERRGSGFALLLDLPLVSAGDVELTRRGDDLLVSVDGRRRVVSLPSALRRCTAAGAKVRDGVLTVRFVPDPDLWPTR